MKKLFVIFASVALIAAFAVSATAADWSMYGSARMATFMVDQDFGDRTFNNSIGDGDDEDLQWDLQGNSRIGANVKNENIKGQFEYGTGVNLRRLYGVYDFGAWSLKIGQDYGPLDQFISGQVFGADLGLLAVGTFYGLRRQRISASFGDFAISLVKPTSADLAATITTAPAQDVDEELPGIEAKWGMKSDMWNFNIRGGYQTYAVDTGPGVKDVDVDSNVIAVDGGINFGQLYVKAAYSMGQNIGVPWYGVVEGSRDPDPNGFGPAGTPIFDVAANDIVDIDTTMYALVVGFKASDQLTIEGGFGFREDDPDTILGTPTQEDDTTTWYVQAVIQVAPGLFIIPEAGGMDYGDTIANSPNGGDSGDQSYFGAKWQINF